jgi:hypothetical protein
MTSKFAGLLQSVRSEEPKPKAKKEQPRKAALKAAPAAQPSAKPQRGRPRAKHSDPSFQQVTAYILKDTHKDVKIALLQQDPPQEFSELVQELLTDWLKGRKN